MRVERTLRAGHAALRFPSDNTPSCFMLIHNIKEWSNKRKNWKLTKAASYSRLKRQKYIVVHMLALYERSVLLLDSHYLPWKFWISANLRLVFPNYRNIVRLYHRCLKYNYTAVLCKWSRRCRRDDVVLIRNDSSLRGSFTESLFAFKMYSSWRRVGVERLACTIVQCTPFCGDCKLRISALM